MNLGTEPQSIEPQSLQPHEPEEFDPDLSTPAAVAIRQTRGGRIFRVVSGFLLGQGAVQASNVLIGLFLVRFLSVEAYAQFGVATAFQSVFSVLMDLGFAGTIIPLVGDRHRDHAVIGRYVRAARHLRDRTFLLLAPLASIAFLITVHRRHWSPALQAALIASILLSLYSGGLVSFFSAPLFLASRLRAYYVPQVIGGCARILAYLALVGTGALNAWTAAVCGALNVTLNGWLIRRAGRRYLLWPAHDDPAADRELLRYVIPATPAIVFSAFQSQISLFLISFFGSTVNIAEVAALSRIGQIFVVIGAFNTVVVEPYIARLRQERLLANFVLFLLLASALMTLPVWIAFRWPGVFLLLLGPRFHGLLPSMGWYVLSAAMNFVSGLLWVMNRARKWVFWDGSILEVVLLLVIQILFLITLGVRTTQQAVLFNLASSGCYAVAHLYVTMRGFLQTPAQEKTGPQAG